MPETMTDAQLSFDEAYHLLSSSRRRLILEVLLEQGDGFDIGELATEVARLESKNRDVSGTHRKTVYISLYQTHVDKLVEVDVLARDDDGSLSRGTHLEELYEMHVAAATVLSDTEGDAPDH